MHDESLLRQSRASREVHAALRAATASEEATGASEWLIEQRALERRQRTAKVCRRHPLRLSLVRVDLALRLLDNRRAVHERPEELEAWPGFVPVTNVFMDVSTGPAVPSAPPLPPLPAPSAPSHFRYREAECATPVAVQVARPEVARPVAGTSTAPFATVVNVQRIVRGWSARGLHRLASWRSEQPPPPPTRRTEPDPAAPNFFEEMYNQIAAWYNEPENAALRARWGPFPEPDEFQTWPGFVRVTNAFLDARIIEP